MSDLENLRDHARFMAAREHGPDCPPALSRPTRAHYGETKWCRSREDHAAHDWTERSKFTESIYQWRCLGYCTGCIGGRERALWTQIANEIDAYLAPKEKEDALW